MPRFLTLQKIESLQQHPFSKPTKRIHDGADVQFFLRSTAHRDIMTFILQLNRALIPRQRTRDNLDVPQVWLLPVQESSLSEATRSLRQIIAALDSFIARAPPDTGPRRFGNVSFRTWHNLCEQNLRSLFSEHFSQDILLAGDELESYLLGSFGSPQRLDYGTGHELSFLAFLGCLWKLGFFPVADAGAEERNIVLGVFESYLKLVRTLIKTYNLEPAGSHGVWGLDDNSFLPYVFGSAQLSPAISEDDDTPTAGSVLNAPDPASVTKENLVNKEKDANMYFSAIAFIYNVKRGPFWEHSPMLFDISGIKDGWGKINKGMIKMYNAEVLSKFPVVQHFPFGSLFQWQMNPEAQETAPTTHTQSQPLRNPIVGSGPTMSRPSAPARVGASWATGRPAPPPVGFVNGVTQAPWAMRRPPGQQLPTQAKGGVNDSLRHQARPPPPRITEDSINDTSSK